MASKRKRDYKASQKKEIKEIVKVKRRQKEKSSGSFRFKKRKLEERDLSINLQLIEKDTR